MKSMHILLVEDNEGDIVLTTEALEDTKMQIKLSVAKDGKQAIDFMNQHAEAPEGEEVHLVLLDVNLPKKNGHEVLKYIKSSNNLKHIPVIMLTTSSSKRDQDICRQNNVDSYIIKPLHAEELLTAIDALENPGSQCNSTNK